MGARTIAVCDGEREFREIGLESGCQGVWCVTGGGEAEITSIPSSKNATRSTSRGKAGEGGGMSGRDKGTSFEVVNGLELGLLEADNSGRGLWNGKPDIVTLAFVTQPSHIQGKCGERSSHWRTNTPPNPGKQSEEGR